MNSKLKVAWYNGMHIDKIHFEQQERFLEHIIHTKTSRLVSNLYGVFDVSFSTDMLNLGKIALTQISGITQDGSVFNAPDDDLLPEVLELPPNMSSPIITLKIPTYSDATADMSLKNTFPNSKYIVSNVPTTSKIHDDMQDYIHTSTEEISYQQEKVSLALGSLRLKLGILGDKSPNELEIPIAKVKNIYSYSKKIELDEKFIPTSIDICSNAFIKSFLEEMLFSIKQHKESFTQIFRGIDQTKNTLDFSTYLSLNLLKKYTLIFSYLVNKEKLHPETLYEKLVEFQADLLTISHNDAQDEFIPYEHNDLSAVFIPLSNNIRLLFANVTSPKYAMAQVIDNGNGFYDCIFDNASMLQDGELFLAVRSSLPMQTLLETFSTQSKIHTQATIKSIVASQLKGLHIEAIPSIPSALPHLSGYVYFKLDKQDFIFTHFAKQNVISLYMTNNITKPDIKLWALFN